ncbi:MAG: tetratricopeptide repeat protein, partial [candidate division WOR-3 bacterium]
FYFYKSKYFEISEEYDSSLYYSRKVISNSSLKERAIPIYVRSALKIGMVDSAMRFIKDLEKNKDLSILLAEAYKEKGDFEKAKEILKNFDSENKNYEVLKILQEIYMKENNISELKRLFKNFMLKGEDYIKKQEIGFELAKIYFEEDSLIPLKDILSEIKKFSPSTNYGVKSGVWLNLIENEEKLKDLEGNKLKEEMLKIAESYYIDLGLYKKALKLFEEYVKNFSEDREIPRVLYLIIFIYKNFLKDEMKTNEFYKILEEKYKGSFYYVISRNLLEKN